jgi:hypothetical protein
MCAHTYRCMHACMHMCAHTHTHNSQSVVEDGDIRSMCGMPPTHKYILKNVNGYLCCDISQDMVFDTAIYKAGWLKWSLKARCSHTALQNCMSVQKKPSVKCLVVCWIFKVQFPAEAGISVCTKLFWCTSILPFKAYWMWIVLPQG